MRACIIIHRRRVVASSSRTSTGLATARSRLGNGLNSSSSLESSLMTIIAANRADLARRGVPRSTAVIDASRVARERCRSWSSTVMTWR